jgi:hypothetical protein
MKMKIMKIMILIQVVLIIDNHYFLIQVNILLILIYPNLNYNII